MSFLLPGLARLWPVLGDNDLLEQIIAIVADRRWRNEYLPSLGELIAAEWERQETDVLAEVIEATTGEGADAPLSQAVIYAVAEYLTQVTDHADRDELVRMLVEGLPPSLFDVGAEALRILLGSESPAALEAERCIRGVLSTVGADAQLNRLTPVQAYLLEMLALSQPTPGLLSRVLPARLGPRDWSTAPSLARLAPAAADQGHAAARRFLSYLVKIGSAPDTVLDAVFAPAMLSFPVHDDVYDLLVSIALQHHRTANLDTLVKGIEYNSRRSSTHAAGILAYVSARLDSSDAADPELGLAAALLSRTELALEWEDLRRLLERVQNPRRLGPLLDALWVQTRPGDTLHQLEFLSHFIQIDAGAPVPVTQADHDAPIAVAISAANAYQRILGRRGTATPDVWPKLRALTLYEVDSGEPFVTGTRFVVACDFLTRLTDSYPAEAGRSLHELLSAAIGGRFRGFTLGLWAREAGAVIHKCLRGGVITITELTGLCLGALDEEVAMVIMSVLADADYRQARPALLDVARRAQEPTTRANATAIVRDHDRQHGTGAFPEIQALFTAR